jgi:hypothetical protein
MHAIEQLAALIHALQRNQQHKLSNSAFDILQASWQLAGS